MNPYEINAKLERWINRGLRVGKMFGIEVVIHPFLMLLFVYWLAIAVIPPGPEQLVSANFYTYSIFETLVFIAVVFGSVLLHEFGHCFGAWLMGGGADRVMLWPLGGLATVRGAERSPYNEFVITLLGPLTTLVLALSATILLWILPGDIVQTAVGREFALFLLQMKIFNWVTFLFNMMIPLFPMDCARLIRSLLSMKFNPQRVTYDLCLAGLFVGGMMVLLFVFSNAGLELPGLQWFTSLISNASVFFLLIAVFGINACMIQLKEIQYAEVYNAPWEGKELVEAWGNTLRDLFRVRPRRGAKVAPPFPQPVAAGKMQARGKTSNPAPQTKPSRALTERERLAAELDDAVKREDFLRAAKIRDQLRGLNDKDDGQP